jgi:hypothetical protein
LSGCATYSPLVKPIPKLSVLSPELENLTDVTIETYLKADVKPVFPSTLAVAKVPSPDAPAYRYGEQRSDAIEILRGEEAAGWRRMVGPLQGGSGAILEQVQFVSPLIVGKQITLKSLRDAAALLHAPLLFVYLQSDSASEGYNDGAMAYWTVVGLFMVPGNAVGHYTVCQGVLIDTRSGFILATTEGEARREEAMLVGALDIARERVERQAQAEAVANLQKNFAQMLAGLAQSRGVRAE